MRVLTFEGAITVHIADVSDSSKVTTLLGSETFDVIIDDGSHVSGDVIAAFRVLYRHLAPGGKFIIEDLHASYWASHGGGFRHPASAIQYFKALVDALNIDHFEKTDELADSAIDELRHFGRSLARVVFYDSVVVVEKLANEKTMPYRRMLGGIEAAIIDSFDGITELPAASIGRLIFADGQKRQIEGKILNRLEEARNDAARAGAEKAVLDAQLAELRHQLASQQEKAVAEKAALLEEVEARITVLDSEIARVTAENARLHLKLGELQHEQAHLTVQRQEDQLQIEGLKTKLNAVYASASWRLTGPLRRVLRLARYAMPGDRRINVEGEGPPVHRGAHIPLLSRAIPCLIAKRLDRIIPMRNRFGRRGSARQSRARARDRAAIMAADLFDRQWYLCNYKDVADTGMDPLDHFLEYGAKEGRNPNQVFDTAWYLRRNPDVAKAGVNPLAHYIRHGAREGRDPSPNFSSRWYLDQNPETEQAGSNPLTHYLREGKILGLPATPPDRTYHSHVANERLWDALERPELLQHIEVMTYRPLFIVLTEGDGDVGHKASINSCRAQIYPNWQIANSRQDVAQLLSASDATRTYLVWITAGDRLSEKALYACASALNADPAADLIYFDEDEWGPEGRQNPFYKPDWSPDYLETMNYVGAAACFRMSKAIRHLASADSLYDFTLQFVEQAEQIKHIRQVLLHRQCGPSSPISADLCASNRRVLAGRLKRTGRSGAITPNIAGFGSYDIKLDLKSKPLVSIVIPTAGKIITYEGRKIDLIANCIDAILSRSTYKNIEFVLVDNGDFDASRLAHVAPKLLKITTFNEPEFNVAKKLNMGAAIASGSMLLLLNDDIEPLAEDWIERMLEHFEKPYVGVVGAKLLYPDLSLQHAGVVLNHGNPDHVRRLFRRDDAGYFFSTSAARNYLAVTGACMMTPASLYRDVGGYTEALAVSFNDVDFCLKARERGFSVVYAPKCELIHYESQSREPKLDHSELAYFYRRWAKVATDLFYNERSLTVAPPTFEVFHNARII